MSAFFFFRDNRLEISGWLFFYFQNYLQGGLTEGSHCSVCGEVIKAQEVILAVGHTVVIDKAKPATCTETGLTEGSHCSVCGEVIKAQEVVPAKGHTIITIKGTAPTCTETGLTDGQKCLTCGEIIKAQEIIPALGHTVVIDKAKPATCTETGLTEGSHCSVCGEVIKAQEVIPALGHTEVIDPEIPATFESEGLSEGSHCSVCGEVLKPQEVLPKLVYMEQKNEKTGIEVIAQNNVKLDVDEVKPIDALNAAVAEMGEKIEKAYDINLLKDDEAVQPSGTVTVKIPCDNPGGKIYRVESNNSLTNMNAKYENGFLVFEADDLGVYVATSPDIVIGDVDGDGTVNINDATMIQKYVAELVTLTPDRLKAADTNGDGDVNINDATQIQKFIAELIDHLG